MNAKFLIATFLIFNFTFYIAHGAAFEYDLGLRQEDIILVPAPSQLIAGQSARIYATVHNFGGKDGRGTVSFFQGPYLLGESQPMSVRAQGFADEVFIDFTVPDGSFNILVKLQQVQPTDQNPANDEAVLPLMTPRPDRDHDGHVDSEDNCPELANRDQADQDTDRLGDACDPDDDNDGLADIDETPRGTNPRSPDTDGDGLGDGKDPRPLTKDVSPLEKKEVLPAVKLIEIQKEPEVFEVVEEPKIIKAEQQVEDVVIMPAVIQKPPIPRGSLPKLWVAAGLSALFAGIFSFLALRLKTPKE